MKNKKNNSNITGNKNNKGLKEKLLGINESNRLKYINNRNIEYEEENDEINNYNNEEEIEEEEINMNVIPTMKKRKAQSIEQVKDKKRLSYIPHQKKIFKLKIEKIKNSNFELKKNRSNSHNTNAESSIF